MHVWVAVRRSLSTKISCPFSRLSRVGTMSACSSRLVASAPVSMGWGFTAFAPTEEGVIL